MGTKNGEMRPTLGTVLVMLFLNSADAADAAADDGAHTVRIHVLEIRAGIFQRLNCRCHGNLCEPLHVADVLAFEVFRRIEVTDDTGNADTQFGGVKAVDLGNTQCSLLYIFPELSTVLPSGLTVPSPVMTTLFIVPRSLPQLCGKLVLNS